MNNRSVLIVDDQPEIRRLLTFVLSREYRVLEAENGARALELARQERPGVMLLDIMMPGEVDGMAVLQALKEDERTRGIHVAMLSAHSQKADVALAHARGADAYFIKPFSPLQVQEWVASRLA